MFNRKAKKMIAEVLKRAYGKNVPAKEIVITENLGGTVSFLFHGREYAYAKWDDMLMGSSRMSTFVVALG